MLDEKDELILNILEGHADWSTYQISKKISIPQTTVLNRIKRLKVSGVIKKFTIELDYKKLNKNVKALIFVKVSNQTEKRMYGEIGSVEQKLMKNPQILTIKRLMGEFDFVVEVVVKDIDELNKFLIAKIRGLDYLTETQTVVVLEEWAH